MKYWAEVGASGNVLRVIVADDVNGHAWLAEWLGGTWVETNMDGSLRKNYAGIGYSYDADRDAFIPPQPYASWVLDEDTCLWVAPIAYPADGVHVWDEEAGDWVEVTDETV